jgi:cytosine permease
MARFSFGNRGSKLASLLLGGTQIGWYGVIIGTIGDLTASAFGIESYAAKATIMVVTSTLMCITALYGYRGKYWVSVISTPLILILAFWVVGRSLQEVGGLDGLRRSALRGDGDPGRSDHRGRHLHLGRRRPNWTVRAREPGRLGLSDRLPHRQRSDDPVRAIGAITFGEGTSCWSVQPRPGWLGSLPGNLWNPTPTHAPSVWPGPRCSAPGQGRSSSGSIIWHHARADQVQITSSSTWDCWGPSSHPWAA